MMVCAYRAMLLPTKSPLAIWARVAISTGQVGPVAAEILTAKMFASDSAVVARDQLPHKKYPNRAILVVWPLTPVWLSFKTPSSWVLLAVGTI